MGCHFLLQCIKVKNEREVAQSCPTLSDPMDCSHQAPRSMGFSRQDYWSGCHCLLRITQLEPDILECKVKWALGIITTNKTSGGDGIPVELFQILKDDAVKCCTPYASKFGKLSSGHRTGKGQFSFQSQRKAMPKNAQTITQFHSSHMLVK